MPSCLPEEVVWASFRKALMNVEYWLSIQEIQFIAAYFGARLHVYLWNAASLQLQDLVEEPAPSCIANHTYADSVSIVLQLSDEASCRGHFSRLLSSDAWDEHLEAVNAIPELVDDSDDDDSTTPSLKVSSRAPSPSPLLPTYGFTYF